MNSETLSMRPLSNHGDLAYTEGSVLVFCVGGLHAADEQKRINQELNATGLLHIAHAQVRYGCLVDSKQHELYAQSNRVIFDHLRFAHGHIMGPQARNFVPFTPRKPKGLFKSLQVLLRASLRAAKRKMKTLA